MKERINIGDSDFIEHYFYEFSNFTRDLAIKSFKSQSEFIEHVQTELAEFLDSLDDFVEIKGDQ